MQSPSLVDFFKHLDVWFSAAIQNYGAGIYALLFLIVFCETGLVFLPFLPGDSLLFTAGTFSVVTAESGAAGALSLPLLYALFFFAALLGDNVNYAVGRFLGRRLFQSETSKVFSRQNLLKTEAFFAKYGPKAVIMARFVPIVRTFSPFVAGMGAMPYPRFLAFSIAGAFLWVGICVSAGHFFGQLPFVKKHFEAVILGIILISIVPMVVEYLMHRSKSGKPESAS